MIETESAIVHDGDAKRDCLMRMMETPNVNERVGDRGCEFA